MLLKAALVVLAVWLAGVLGLYEVGTLVHIPLFVGLMMLLLGILKARDAAANATSTAKPSTKGRAD